jgi:outer membrane protein TolC
MAPQTITDGDVRYGQVLRVAQRFPFPGTLKLQGRIAGAEAEASFEEWHEVRLDLATVASLLFDDYYVVHRALEINDEHTRLLEDLKRIATARYAAGIAPQQDPLQAEVELAHLMHDKVLLGSSRDVLVAQINSLMHRPPEAALPPPPPSLSRLSMVEPSGLQDEALGNRPDLLASSAEVRAREAAVELKKKDSRPHFEAMTSYNSMWNQSEHRWMVGAAINLPVRRKRIRAGVAEAQARLAQRENERRRLEDQVRAQVQQAYIRLQEAHHVVELYQSRLLPAARDQVKAAVSGFETSQNSFLAVIEAEKNQRTVELRHQESLAAVYGRQAELDRSVGRIPVVGSQPSQENSSE